MAALMFNFNVGVLGHVDSGKTSLSKVLSTTASTACFDKNPQSKERGITLDLGFSSFTVDMPDHLCSEYPDLTASKLQYTLVDCPGHASLIRTIIGGAQIIDLMILVIDIVKGMQTQTAECLVIGEITCPKMIVVLNKVDLLPPDKKEAMIEKMKKRMQKTMETTKFAGCPIIPVAARPGGPEGGESDAIGLTDLIETLKTHTYRPKRNPEGPFIFSVDHCFSIRGQGTVMTGTALSGKAVINDTVEIPSMNVNKKIKSIQMFKQPTDKIVQGDRAGVCVTQFDPKQLERGLVCTPGSLPTFGAGIMTVSNIPYYKGAINSKAKFHITTGHETVMAKVTFFGLYEDPNSKDNFITNTAQKDQAEAQQRLPIKQYAFIEYEKPVTCPHNSLVIGSKLDTDIHANMCRIAFHGQLLECFTDSKYLVNNLPKLKVYKTKVREGLVERCQDEYTLIGKNLFKKETNIQSFVGLKVTLSSGEKGVIEGGFGQSGKFKIRIPDGVSKEIQQKYSGTKKKNKNKDSEANQDEQQTDHEPIKIFLTFKRYVFDPEKKMKQS
ncbi:selB [Mytilus coruscus]|uniref:Selenocysteine-specific elongation factor n=1 Tax=Mytilus coruscus TaxID=42192 RepID=A0A6J8AA49_MYTCO|nr:selB [Mytilus coruscus]